MQLDKRDLLAITVLAVIFFSVATWNLGLAQSPLTTWQTSENKSFYLDLGRNESIGAVYFLVQRGNVTVRVYTGSPGNWSYSRAATFDAYNLWYNWQKLDVNSNTQYLQFDIQPGLYDSRPQFYWSVPSPSDALPHPFIEFVEIAVLNQNNQQVSINAIASENVSDPNLSKLVDEQALVQCPPTYFSETYFDEFYFIRAAQDYLRLQAPYERTHPPLGKLILACGISVFGSSPFGLRITGVLFGTLMIPVMYLLGKKLFGTWIGAFSSAFLLTFDFMHFTMARMATADTYVVFFSLLSQLFFLIYFVNVVKKGWKTSVLPLFFAVIFFALGFSTKWLALYSAIGMLALLAALRLRDVVKRKESIGAKYAAFFDHPFLLLLGFIAVAVGLYFLAYIPDMLAGNTLPSVVKLQFEMFNFHSTLTATHPYMSAWWSWPLMVRPLFLSVAYLPNGIKSSISVFGNPAVWWVGFASMIVVTERAIRGKELWKMLTLNLKKITAKSLKLVSHFLKKLTGRQWSCEKKIPIFSYIFDLIMKRGILKPQTAETTRRGYDLAAIFISTIFFFSWLPYILISRVTFIYHFYVSMPFLCLASAYLINKSWSNRWGKVAAIALFVSVIVMFGLFYPVISGVPTPTSYTNNLHWFKSWDFL